MRKITAWALVGIMSLSMITGCTKATVNADVSKETQKVRTNTSSSENWDEFVINASEIPQETLDTTLYIACSIRGLENPYYITVTEGVEMFCKYLDSIGQKYEMQILDSGGSNDVEIDNMKQFAAKANGNAIAYADPNESATAPSLAEAIAESGAYFGTAWNKPDDVAPEDYDPNWVIHTSANNVASGHDTAVALFESMGGKGKVFVIEGLLGNTASNDRVQGFLEALNDYPDIEVAHRDAGNWATDEALTLVETWLVATPDVGGVWCANDSMATGALQALDAKGLKGKVGVTGIDANTDIVAEVKAGNVVATNSSNGYLQSGYTLAICYAVWAGLVDPMELPSDYRTFFTPSVLITADTVEGYIVDYVDSAPDLDFSHIFGGRAE